MGQWRATWNPLAGRAARGLDSTVLRATTTWRDADIKHYISPEDSLLNSADFSSIEGIWSIITTAAYADTEPQSLHALKHCTFLKSMDISLSANTSKSYQFDA